MNPMHIAASTIAGSLPTKALHAIDSLVSSANADATPLPPCATKTTQEAATDVKPNAEATTAAPMQHMSTKNENIIVRTTHDGSDAGVLGVGRG